LLVPGWIFIGDLQGLLWLVHHSNINQTEVDPGISFDHRWSCHHKPEGSQEVLLSTECLQLCKMDATKFKEHFFHFHLVKNWLWLSIDIKHIYKSQATRCFGFGMVVEAHVALMIAFGPDEVHNCFLLVWHFCLVQYFLQMLFLHFCCISLSLLQLFLHLF